VVLGVRPTPPRVVVGNCGCLRLDCDDNDTDGDKGGGDKGGGGV